MEIQALRRGVGREQRSAALVERALHAGALAGTHATVQDARPSCPRGNGTLGKPGQRVAIFGEDDDRLMSLARKRSKSGEPFARRRRRSLRLPATPDSTIVVLALNSPKPGTPRSRSAHRRQADLRLCRLPRGSDGCRTVRIAYRVSSASLRSTEMPSEPRSRALVCAGRSRRGALARRRALPASFQTRRL